MPTRPTFPLYDKILNGKLEGQLRAWRATGTSYDEISILLDRLGVKASRTTVKRWCDENEIA